MPWMGGRRQMIESTEDAPVVSVKLERLITFDDMLDSWAESEIEPLRRFIGEDSATLIHHRKSSAQDRRVARYAVFLRRRPVLIPFLMYSGQWYEAAADVSALHNLRTYLFMDEAYSTVGQLATKHPEMFIPDFDPTQVFVQLRGRPIMVSKDGVSSWYLIDGTHRCCEVIRMTSGGKCAGVLPVIAGIYPQLDMIIARSLEFFADVPKSDVPKAIR